MSRCPICSGRGDPEVEIVAGVWWEAEFYHRQKCRLYVVRHSGRAGARWRVVYATDDPGEAWEDYVRRLPRTPFSYAVTRILRGPPPNGVLVATQGGDPTPGGSETEWGTLSAAEEALEIRKARFRVRTALRSAKVLVRAAGGDELGEVLMRARPPRARPGRGPPRRVLQVAGQVQQYRRWPPPPSRSVQFGGAHGSLVPPGGT